VSAVGLKEVCLRRSIESVSAYCNSIEQVCVCCRSRAGVSAVDLEQVRMLQVSIAGVSSSVLELVCLLQVYSR
jgi:archaellin